MLTAAHPAPRNKEMVTARLQTLRSQHIITSSLIISRGTCQERYREGPGALAWLCCEEAAESGSAVDMDSLAW